MKSGKYIYLFALVLLLFGIRGLSFADDCRKCHEDIFKGKMIHQPVKSGCSSCHVSPHAVQEPELSLKSNMPMLCYDCHDRAAYLRKYQHAALKEKCISCHDPHSSDYPALLKSGSVELCFKCHDKKLMKGKNIHSPAAVQCTFCHDPHSSDNNEKLLTFTMPSLCFRCHDSGNIMSDRQHKPVSEGLCTECHDPHSGDINHLLTDEIPGLCFKCHEKDRFEGKFIHWSGKDSCLGCHTAHNSKSEKLLRTAEPDLCFKCHDRKGFEGGKNVHKPLVSGKCTICHAAHASKSGDLLAKSMSSLCFDCHKKTDLVKGREHGPFKIGMCGSCHFPHQGPNPKLLKKTVPDLCFSCHDTDNFAMKNVHKPVSEGKCLVCHGKHEPYPGDKDVENAMCRKCHKEIFDRPHPELKTADVFRSLRRPSRSVDSKLVSQAYNAIKSGHPISGADDPMRPGKQISCVSCHDPHSSDSGSLLRYKAKKSADLCVKCHKKD